MGFLVFGHYIVYQMFINAWPSLTIQSPLKLSVVLLGGGLNFILLSILVSRSRNKLVQFLYTLSAYWLGAFSYFFLSALLWGILMIFSDSIELTARISVVLASLVILYGAINAWKIRIKEYFIEMKGLPEDWKSKKIIMLSDLHFGAVNGIGYAKRIVEEIQKLSPDIVFIVGDFFDGVKVNERALAEVFALLKPKDGVYFVMGNHDEFTDNREKEKLLKHAGMIVLDNQKTIIDGVQIIGVDYKTTVHRGDLERALRHLSIDKTKPSILLRHAPSHIDVLAEAKISLVLSGHTHNGQMYPVNYIASRAHQGFGYGLKTLKETQVLVSSGVGTWGPPLRVGTHSEILILNLK
ncbi:metallophosphoesterase [soil metagenome]